MIPDRMPVKGLAILEKATALTSEAIMPGAMTLTTPVDSRFVIISQETRPARADVPSLSSDSPTATPMTNSNAIWSISAPPALTSRKPMLYSAPLVAAPGTPITPGAIA